MTKAVTPPESPVGCPASRAPLRSLMLAASILLVGGCASTTEVKVDSLAKPTAAGEAVSYQIRNSNPLMDEDSLRYKEAAEYVKTALSGRGMYEAPPNTKADVIVNLDFGIGEPQMRKREVSEPMYVTVQGAVRLTTAVIGYDKNGAPILGTVAVQEPARQEFAGMREYEVIDTVYEKYLRLSARENAPASEGRPPAEIWTVDVTSEGESRDVRKNLPVLVAASIDYVGKDTHGQKSVKIKDKGEDVAFVKKGM